MRAKIYSALLGAVVIGGCGGGGSDDNAPQGEFTIAGKLTGLAPDQSLVLANNDGQLTLSASGGFEFQRKLALGQTYNISVVRQPARQNCSVVNGGGSVTGTVVDILVQCNYIPNDADTSQACLENAQLYRPGNTWAVTNALGTTKTTVNGVANFHGHDAYEHHAVRSDGSSETTYTNQTEGVALNYGWIEVAAGQPVRERFYSPVLSHPLAMKNNTSHKMFTDQENTVDGRPSVTLDIEYDVAYMGREAIQTTFGTFETCHMTFRAAYTNPIAPWSRYRNEWLIASGKYAGLPAAQMVNGAMQVTTKLDVNWN